MSFSEFKINLFVAKTTFVVAQINFKVASVADISLFLAKITFVVAYIIIKEDAITSSVAKINNIEVEITSKVAVNEQRSKE